MSEATAAPVADLATCDREPIHIPGTIQPHGLLLALEEAPDRLLVRQAAGPCLALLGRDAADLLDQPLEPLLAPASLAALRQRLGDLADLPPVDLEGRQQLSPLSIALADPRRPHVFDGILHRSGGLAILELEPRRPTPDPLAPRGPGGFSFERLHAMVHGPSLALQHARSVDELQRLAARVVKRLTGFDRVMVYRFDSDWHGEVVAEEKEDRLEPFLGLHYPASDIPLQARKLYTLNRIRLIADIAATPAPLAPTLNPLTGQPLDLSHAVLRAVSPIHIEYLRNMGVTASMSISLVKHDQLWGLIACHGYSGPHHVTYEIRMACEFLGQIVSLLLPDLLIKEDYLARLAKDALLGRLGAALDAADDIVGPLLRGDPTLLDLLDATGAALVRDGQVHALGRVPAPEDLLAMVRHLTAASPRDRDARPDRRKVFVTRRLAKEYPPAEAWPDLAAGCIMVRLSFSRPDCLLWFKPEVLQTVSWAGDPAKSVVVEPDGVRLSPRKSFQAWKEVVRGQSLPWSAVDDDAARRLRVLVLEAERRRAEEALQRQNEEIERQVAQRTRELHEEIARREQAQQEVEAKNAELERFTYAVSHDLKSPLVTIMGFAGLLEEDALAGDQDRVKADIARIANAARKMQILLDELLRLSRVGRLENTRERIDMNALLADVLELVAGRLALRRIQVEVQPGLPAVLGDRARIQEVFLNLLDNAAKFMPGPDIQPHPRIRARGEVLGGQARFIVEDNGPGLDPRHRERIFNIFEKLDPATEGAGVGLALVKRIVEKHGGQVTARSDGPGAGAAFLVTLPLAPAGFPDATES